MTGGPVGRFRVEARRRQPGLAAAAGGVDESADQDRLPLRHSEIATEQAIQFDELIRWVSAQASVDRNVSK